MQRSNNIAIALSRFKVSNDTICDAILRLDESVLSLEQVISSPLPSEEGTT